MVMMITSIFIGFFLGAITIIAIEAIGVLYLVRRFNCKIGQQKTNAVEAEAEAAAASKSPREVCEDYPDLSHPNKQVIFFPIINLILITNEHFPIRYLTET